MSDNKNIMNHFPLGEKNFYLSGNVGQLEVLTNMPADPKPIVAVICHPHPLFGGTMHNKVVYTVARALRELNIATVRFNFRGVGRSEGQYDAGVGESEDVLSILQWIKSVQPDAHIWLAGFSFGAYVAARAAAVWPVTQLISIAPAVVNFDFSGLIIKCPWLIVQGDMDEIVDPQAVFQWIATLTPAPEVIRMPAADHFFHGQLVELRQSLIQALSNKI